MLVHAKRVTICTHDTDVRGTLCVKALFDLFNDVANEQTLGLGVDVDTFHAMGITWMLHRIRLRVERMPVKGEEVLLETWPSGADRLFAFRDFAMRDADGRTLARITSEWMVIDLARRRPVRLPEPVLAMAKHYEGVTRDMNFTLAAGTPPPPVTGQRRFVAAYDTIDFNRHVTQASYVGWVVNALPFDFLCKHAPRELEVLYEHEILPDSEVDSIYQLDEGEGNALVAHRVVNAGGSVTHCTARGEWTRVP